MNGNSKSSISGHASYGDMTMPEIRSRTDGLLFLPVGSIEQHGAHMPVDTDGLLASKISQRVAAVVGGLVAPPLSYGCRSLPVSGGGELFPGTISLSGETLTRMVADLLSTFARHGHRRIILINGHYENTMFVIEGVKRAQVEESFQALVIDWWNILRIDRLQEIFEGEFPGWEAEHAGIIETSLMMHLAPERVQAERIENRIGHIAPPTYTVLPERPGLVDPSGILRTAWGANAELGKEIAEEIETMILGILNTEFSEPPSTGMPA